MSLARRKGLEDALAEDGLELHPEWMASGFPNVAGGFQAMSALLSLPEAERPTAVQTYNDLMALGALKAIRTHRLRVPDDISVVGFDDIYLAESVVPSLTTMRVDKQVMGRLAVQLLLNQVFQAEGSYVTSVFRPLLIERNSTMAVGKEEKGGAIDIPEKLK